MFWLLVIAGFVAVLAALSGVGWGVMLALITGTSAGLVIGGSMGAAARDELARELRQTQCDVRALKAKVRDLTGVKS